MKYVLLLVAFTMFFTIIKSQNITIPDANFNACLLGNTSINTNSDNEIQLAESTAYAGTIDCGYKSIANLTGIEAFVNITGLNCSGNQLKSLDLSQNAALEYLWCSGNQLTSLDLSKNTALTQFSCGDNQLTSLDVSPNRALQYLGCVNNQLPSLDLSQNTALEYLWCFGNQLPSLDVGQNTALKEIRCDYNSLTSLDVSQNTALAQLYCNSNQLTSLDVSQNTALKYLWCGFNQLTALNVKNGHNSNLTSFDASATPLICIQVDDANASASYAGWYKDAIASYNTDCGYTMGVTAAISDAVKIFPNPVTETLFVTRKSNIKVYNACGEKVGSWKEASSIDMTGLIAGIYMVILTDKEGREIQRSKIVKN